MRLFRTAIATAAPLQARFLPPWHRFPNPHLFSPYFRLFSSPAIEYFEEFLSEGELEEINDSVHRPAEKMPRRSVSSLDIKMNHFSSLHLRRELLLALSSYDINTPTEIQRLAIGAILSGNSVQIGAQTGNGKTLAFLLPIINRLRDEEEQGVIVRPSRPRAVILAPSRELAQQIHAVAKSLAHHAKIRSVLLIAGHGRKQQRQQLAGPMDLLIATPGRLRDVMGKEVFLSDVRFTVLDEADTLCSPDAGFAELVADITRGRREQAGHQFILAGASFSKVMQARLQELFPGVLPLRDAQVHKAMTHVVQKFRLVGAQDKQKVLQQILAERPDDITLVFCNTMSSCRSTSHFLEECGLQVGTYHGGMPPKLREQHWSEFARGEARILVTTDLCSRGLDTTHVTHVVMFDFPLNPVDYIHRAGRTGRLGQSGVITSLVTKRDRVLATAIERANASGLPLEELSSSKRAYLINKPTKALVTMPRDGFLVQTTRIKSRIRVSGGGKAWMAPNVYQAYRNRRLLLTRGKELISKSEQKKIKEKKSQLKQLKSKRIQTKRQKYPKVIQRAAIRAQAAKRPKSKSRRQDLRRHAQYPPKPKPFYE